MAQTSSSVIATVGQPGPSTAVAGGSAPNSNPSNTPRIAHTQPPADAARDDTESQGAPAPNFGKFDWHGDRMLHIYMRDYLVKRNFTKAAQVLASEASIRDDETPPLNHPQGLLFEWWVVLWDLFMAKTGEGNGGTQNAHLYLQAHKQQPLGPGQPSAIPHGYTHQLGGYLGQGGPQPHILPSGVQSQLMPVQERMVQQPNGPHPYGQLMGQMIAPTAVGTLPRPLVGQSGGPPPTQNSQPMPNSGQFIPPGAHPAPPSQGQGVVHGQIPWHPFSQGQPGTQGPTMQPQNPLASQPGQAPVQSQMRAAHEYSQAQQQQHTSMSRQPSATGPNGAPQPQPGPTVNGQPGRPLNVYQNPNIPSGGVNGNPAIPNAPPGHGQSPQVTPYPPQPYQPQAQQHPHPHPHTQNPNQPNPYPPSMLPPSFPPQPSQQQQPNPQPQTPRIPPSGSQTPGPSSHVAPTPQQVPSDTPRTHPQQPPNFPFPSQQLAGANLNGGSNTPMNPPFTPSLQQQQRPFDGPTNNTPGRPGMSMLPPPQSARVNAPVGMMNSRFNAPASQQSFGVGPPQSQQPGALGPASYNGAMGTGGILPSGAAGAIHHGTGTPMPHSLSNFAASQPQQQGQYPQSQIPPQPQPPQSLHQPQSQPQLQAQPQSASSTPLPNGHAPNISRAPTPAQQQQPPATNVQRSATSTPAPNGANLGSSNVSPARGTSVARTGAVTSQQQSDAALLSLLPPGPPGRQPAQQQQQAILAMQRGAGPARSFNGVLGSFAGSAVSTSQQQAQHEVHAGMKRTSSPSNGGGGPSDGPSSDVKRPRRNSQGMADGNAPGAPTVPNGVGRATMLGSEAGNMQPGSASAAQQMLQLRQGPRRPAPFPGPAAPQSYPANPNGIPMSSPQPGAIPPLSNALSEHASAQITAASAAAPTNRVPALVGLNPPAPRTQQPMTMATTRSVPPSPPPGSTHKATMPPPQQSMVPNPLNKDQGKTTNAQAVPASEQTLPNPSRAPSSTPKFSEQKPPTPAPATFPQASNPSAPLAHDPADDSSPSLSRPSPSTSGGGSSTTNNSLNMQANFNYDNSIYMPGMSDQFGGADFGMPEMFPEGAFGEANDMFMMDFETILSDKPFDSSNNDDYTSVGHF